MSRDMPPQMERAETASVVAFRGRAAPRFRREPRDEPSARGEILLFTGVRYERMPEPGATPASLLRRRS